MAGLVALALLPLTAYGAAFPPASTNCTEAASKAASWTVRGFTFDTDTRFDYGVGTAGKASFNILNSANGYEFKCVQGDGGNTGRQANRFLKDGKVWYSCNVFCNGAKGRPREDDPPLDTAFHFDPKTKALSLSQTWTCGSAATNYTGTGTAVTNTTCSALPGGRPEQVSCSPVDITVKASNISVNVDKSKMEDEQPDVDGYLGGPDAPSPFLAPVIPVPAVKPSTPGCSKLSVASPSWSVSNLAWSRGGIAFQLKSSALNYTQRCNVQGAGGALTTPIWSNCTRFDNMHANYPSNEVFTTIYYGGPKNVLGINQTWYCADEDAARPTVFSLYGEVAFPIKCREAKYCIPPSQFDPDSPWEAAITEACKADDMTIAPSKTDKYQVSKEVALQAFKPRGYNCTAKSLGEGGAAASRVWEVKGISISRTTIPPNPAQNFTGGHTDEVEFWYNNTATDNDWPRNTGYRQCLYISDTNNDLEGLTATKKVACGLSFEQFRMGFTFDNKTSTITLNQAWTCDGSDSQHSNSFVASGSTKLNLNCKTTGIITKCTSESLMTIPMANVTSTLNTGMAPPYLYVPGQG